jgi:lipid-A-disaccharide synthase
LGHPIEIVGFGGPQMAAAGCRLLHDMTPLALMFFWRVIRRLPTFFRLLHQAGTYFRDTQVDAVVLIDYPGFNWWVARQAKRYGIPVFYYGAPQIWAWAPWRVRKLRRLVDYVLCQLPFEPAWYAERNCAAFFAGHPFFDEPNEPLPRCSAESKSADALRMLLLLPGSRQAEVAANAECFFQAAQRVRERNPGLRVVFACYNQAQADLVRGQIGPAAHSVEIVSGQTRELIAEADACIACSGSVSLQLLVARIPSVIYFQITRTQWLIKFLLMRVKYITLVNLFWTADIRRDSWWTFDPDRPGAEPVPMPEYLATRPCPDRLAGWVLRWLEDPQERSRAVAELDRLARQYAIPGATRRGAEFIGRVLDPDARSARAA